MKFKADKKYLYSDCISIISSSKIQIQKYLTLIQSLTTGYSLVSGGLWTSDQNYFSTGESDLRFKQSRQFPIV